MIEKRITLQFESELVWETEYYQERHDVHARVCAAAPPTATAISTAVAAAAAPTATAISTAISTAVAISTAAAAAASSAIPAPALAPRAGDGALGGLTHREPLQDLDLG